MIYVFHTYGDSYDFILVPDEIHYKYQQFLKEHLDALSICNGVAGIIKEEHIVDDDIEKTDIEYYFRCYIIYFENILDYNYPFNKNELYNKLSKIPKDIIKHSINKWKENIWKGDRNLFGLEIEQNLDRIYDEIMIKDIIE
jgi:hypothetical protein